MRNRHYCGRCKKEVDTTSGGELKCPLCGNSLPSGDGVIRVYGVYGKHKKPDDIIFRCKLCNKKYRLSKEVAGIEAECARCKKILVVPRHSDSPEETATDRIAFRCHECSQKYRLPAIYANRKARCTRCHIEFIIPAAGAAQSIPAPRRPAKAAGESAIADQPRAAVNAGGAPVPPPGCQAEAMPGNSHTHTSVEIAGITPVKYVLIASGSGIFHDAIRKIRQAIALRRPHSAGGHRD